MAIDWESIRYPKIGAIRIIVAAVKWSAVVCLMMILKMMSNVRAWWCHSMESEHGEKMKNNVGELLENGRSIVAYLTDVNSTDKIQDFLMIGSDSSTEKIQDFPMLGSGNSTEKIQDFLMIGSDNPAKKIQDFLTIGGDNSTEKIQDLLIIGGDNSTEKIQDYLMIGGDNSTEKIQCVLKHLKKFAPQKDQPQRRQPQHQQPQLRQPQRQQPPKAQPLSKQPRYQKNRKYPRLHFGSMLKIPGAIGQFRTLYWCSLQLVCASLSSLLSSLSKADVELFLRVNRKMKRSVQVRPIRPFANRELKSWFRRNELNPFNIIVLWTFYTRPICHFYVYCLKTKMQPISAFCLLKFAVFLEKFSISGRKTTDSLLGSFAQLLSFVNQSKSEMRQHMSFT